MLIEDIERFAKFSVISLGHPLVLFIYVIFGCGVGGLFCRTIGSNTTAINIIPFVTFALIFYYLLLSLQYKIIQAKNDSLEKDKFITIKLGNMPMVISVVGLFHLFVWVTGMEGNVFGFLFFLPLLIQSTLSFCVWIRHTYVLIHYQEQA